MKTSLSFINAAWTRRLNGCPRDRACATGSASATPEYPNPQIPKSPSSGFTLVELLVVITIIGILIALLLPAVQAAREAARQVQCINNHKQIGIALHNYHDIFGCFPPASMADYNSDQTNGSSVHWSWSALILPYVEKDAIHEDIKFEYEYNTEENQEVIKHFVNIYICPDAAPAELVTCCYFLDGEEDVAETHYSAITTWCDRSVHPAAKALDGDGVMYTNSGTRIADIHDGTNSTIMVAEHDSDQEDRATLNPAYCPNLDCYIGLYWASQNEVTTAYGINSGAEHKYRAINSYHPGGAQFLFADGHADFISELIDQAILKALTTRDGGEIIDAKSF